jgi:TolB-like protein
MEGDSPGSAGAPGRAVFLSYASEDVEAAQRICTALRSAGIEVWFDRSELRGGDAWDRQIRKQIHDCALFVPVISAHSDARHEGYFRREWRLAVERAGDMADDVPFLLPVVIDDTADATARVPDRFREVQWSRLPQGQPSAAFIERAQRLLSPTPARPSPASPATAAGAGTERPVTSRARPAPPLARQAAPWVALGALLLGSGYFLVRSDLLPGHRAPAPVASDGKSIAVLPFLDMSEKHDQEYFSDGLTEELIDRLAHSPDLKVIARTSAFAFKGKNEDARDIAAKLGVANLLEGSVRKSENALRITAQLIRARDGAHLWSQSYDRNEANIFQIQEEIAATVSSALQAALSGQAAAARTSNNPEAYNAFLRGKYFYERTAPGDMERSIAAYRDALRLDPNYALAWVGLARAFNWLGIAGQLPPQEAHARALEAANKALTIDPNLADAHRSLAALAANYDFDFEQYRRETARALELDPQLDLGTWAAVDALAAGRTAEAVAAAQRVVARDPLSVAGHLNLAITLYNDGRFADAEAATQHIFELNPSAELAHLALARILLAQKRPDKALEALGHETNDIYRQIGQVDVLWALGRRSESSALLQSYEQHYADKQAVNIAASYVQRGDPDAAFRWLDRAYENREPELGIIRGLWDFRELHGDPRYQALLARLKLD